MENKNTILPNTFPKAEKLKSRKAIDGLFKSGKSFFIHPYKVFFQVQQDGVWQIADGGQKETELQRTTVSNKIMNIDDNILLANTEPPPSAIHYLPSVQVGFAVSTKNFKHAVDRNRIKRLGREAYRLNKHALVSHLANEGVQLQVFFVFTNKSLPSFVSIQQAMQACLRKLIKTTKKNEGLLQG